VKPVNRAVALGCGLAMLAGLPTISYADSSSTSASSVTLYGLLDSGMEYLTNAASNASGNHSVLRAQSGGMSGSRWGIKGSEDLGGGSRAFFLLESGINLNTGTALQGSREFGRLAYVGVANRTYGTLSLGRQGGIMLDWLSKYNPLGNAVYAIKMNDPAFSDRLDNTVRYQKKFGDFTALTQYSFGYDNVSYGVQPAGDTRLGRVIEAGLEYKHGPLDMAITYDQKNGGSTNRTAAQTSKAGGYEGNIDRRIGIGASYRLASVDLFGGYRYMNAKAWHLTTLSQGPVEVSGLYWLGATYHATSALLLSGTAMYQNFAGTSRDPWSFQMDADYFLSKRTDLYVNVAYVLNRNGSNLGLNGFGTDVVAGKNQLGTQIGIRHTF
jgi:predicted porin